MKRVSKAVGAIVAVGIAIAAMTTSSSSIAGDETLLNVSCSNGAVSVTVTDAAHKAGWHINKDAPWSWDKAKPAHIDESGAQWKGDKCAGNVKAFICNGDQCKGPISVAVK